ncbi:hypothetical protein SMICM304S_08776 [Streptomyces microflavus]
MLDSSSGYALGTIFCAQSTSELNAAIERAPVAYGQPRGFRRVSHRRMERERNVHRRHADQPMPHRRTQGSAVSITRSRAYGCSIAKPDQVPGRRRITLHQYRDERGGSFEAAPLDTRTTRLYGRAARERSWPRNARGVRRAPATIGRPHRRPGMDGGSFGPPPRSRRSVKELYDVVAHELAERVRADRRAPSCYRIRSRTTPTGTHDHRRPGGALMGTHIAPLTGEGAEQLHRDAGSASRGCPQGERQGAATWAT